MTDKEEFLKLMGKFKVDVTKHTYGCEVIAYDVSDNPRIACHFNFNESGEFIDVDCYN